MELATKEDLEIMKNELIYVINQKLHSKMNDDYITKDEALIRLGCKETKLSDLRKSGEVTVSKTGKEYLYKLESINNLLERNKIKSFLTRKKYEKSI